jgi:hypothetical protein
MGIWIEGFTGDAAGKVVGREPNTLLVTVSRDVANGLADPLSTVKIGDVEVFQSFHLTCLTAGSLDAWVTRVRVFGTYRSVYELRVAQVDLGLGEGVDREVAFVPWEPGVHLFSVIIFALNEPMGRYLSTFATAVINKKVKQIGLTEPGEAARALMALDEARQESNCYPP